MKKYKIVNVLGTSMINQLRYELTIFVEDHQGGEFY